MYIADLAVSVDDHIARLQWRSWRKKNCVLVEEIEEIPGSIFGGISIQVNSPLARAKRPSTKASERNFIVAFLLGVLRTQEREE